MNAEALRTVFMDVPMKSPVIAASGTFGFGREYAAKTDITRLGGISGKGLTLGGSGGNEGERLYETPAGLLNSIGLENPGVRHFIQHECVAMRALGPAVIVNLGGHSELDYIEGALLLNEADYDILELNISCPNVKLGGMAFGMAPETAADIVKKVKAVAKKPVLVKLSPNATDIVAVAVACEQAGADGISLVNTFLGMAIDIKKRAPVFKNVYAGLSGPAIMPIALRMVHAVAHAVSIPVVGMGGIMTAEDALCFMMAGARAIQVGTGNFANINTINLIIDGLEAYNACEGLKNIGEICGIV